MKDRTRRNQILRVLSFAYSPPLHRIPSQGQAYDMAGRSAGHAPPKSCAAKGPLPQNTRTVKALHRQRPATAEDITEGSHHKGPASQRIKNRHPRHADACTCIVVHDSTTSRREQPRDMRRSWLRRPTCGQNGPPGSHPRDRAASPALRQSPCSRWHRTG